MFPGIGGLFLPRQSQPGIETFSSTGSFSFTVPLFTTMTIKIWGAGGSGGNAFRGGSSSQGGEGGYYTEYSVADFGLVEGSVEPVYIGIPGPGRTGNVGGVGGQYSQFGESIWAQGGQGGNGSSVSRIEPTTLSRIYNPTNPRPSVFTLIRQETGGTFGSGSSTPGGSVIYAGGGGGGMVNDGGQTDGGTSTNGGAGGNGGDAAENQPRNAFSPAGGGGATDWDGGFPSGNGGNGRIIISWT